MNFIGLLLLPYVVALLLLPLIRKRHYAGHSNALFCVLSFMLSICLVYVVYLNNTPLFFFNDWFMCDKLSAVFVLLNSFIGMITSFYNITYFSTENEARLHPLVYQFYYSAYQLFLLGMSVVLLSNNIAMMWIAIELATIASIALVGLRQTAASLEAAWKYLILCGVGIGFALLGTVILYFAAYTHGLGESGLLWTKLMAHANEIPIKLLTISFVFLFVGYGTKAGFVPLHNWLPDAYAEGYPMINALSSGALLNVALFALLKFKFLFLNTELSHFPSYLFLVFGFISLFFASLSLFRQRELNRLFAYSSIEHMGLISIALGIGSKIALTAALLHIWMHALTKTTLFFSSGIIIQQFSTQTLTKIRALFVQSPFLASIFFLALCALLGLPPSGLFISELLLIFAAMNSNIAIMLFLIIGLSLAFFAIVFKIQPLFFGQFTKPINSKFKNLRLSYAVITLNVVIVMFAGFYAPIFVIDSIDWYIENI